MRVAYLCVLAALLSSLPCIYGIQERNCNKNQEVLAGDEIPASVSEQPLRRSKTEAGHESLGKLHTAMRRFFTKVEEYTGEFNFIDKEPTCYWRLEAGLISALRPDEGATHHKLPLLSLQYEPQVPFQIGIGFKNSLKADRLAKPNPEPNPSRLSGLLWLYCPQLLADEQFKSFLKVVRDVQNEFKPLGGAAVYEDDMEINVLEIDCSNGMIFLRLAPDDVEKTEKVVTIFDVKKTLNSIIKGSGGRVRAEEWTVTVPKGLNLYSVELPQITFIDKSEEVKIECPQCMKKDSFKSMAHTLVNFVYQLGGFTFPVKAEAGPLKPVKVDPLKKVKESELEAWMKSNKKMLDIDAVESTIVIPGTSTLVGPAFMGMVFNGDLKSGYFVIPANNGFGIARFTIKPKAKKLPPVIEGSPFFDNYYIPLTPIKGFYNCKIGKIEILIPADVAKK